MFSFFLFAVVVIHYYRQEFSSHFFWSAVVLIHFYWQELSSHFFCRQLLLCILSARVIFLFFLLAVVVIFFYQPELSSHFFSRQLLFYIFMGKSYLLIFSVGSCCYSVLHPFQDYFSSYETGQSAGGAKTGEPREKIPGTPTSRT